MRLHHLSLPGRCNGCDKNCKSPSLKATDFDCLWFLAPHRLCFKVHRGKDCDDPNLIYENDADHSNGLGDGQRLGFYPQWSIDEL